MKKYLSTTLAISSTIILAPGLSFGNALVTVNEAFIGIGTGNIDGQSTSPTPNDYFDGTETWSAVTSSFSSRGYRGSNTALSYNGIGGVGGSVDVFRDAAFNSGTLGNRAYLEPTTQPTGLDYNASGSLYFSFLVNFDGYTARADDGVQQGVLVDFEHDTTSNPGNAAVPTDRAFGIHIGGATGGDSTNFRLSLQTQANKDIEVATWDLIDTGLDLAAGTNLIQLRLVDDSVTVSGDARYEVFLNPSSPSATPDFVHEEQFGIVQSNSDFGFGNFGISQSLNDEQSILIDELYLGETSAVVPEPSTFAMVAGVFALGFVATRRRHSIA
jgi:hypothetical protein